MSLPAQTLGTRQPPSDLGSRPGAKNRWLTADGQWVVDVISVSATGTRLDGVWLRIRQHGFFAGEVRGLEDLARFPFTVTDLQSALPSA